MTSLVYRGPTTPTTGPSQTTKSVPLTIDEVNQNFFALNADIQTRLQLSTGGSILGNTIVSGTGSISLATTGIITAYQSGGTTGALYLSSDLSKGLTNNGTAYSLPGQGLLLGGNVNVNGTSTTWGTTSGVATGGVNVVMGTSTNSTWLLSATSASIFRTGIQALDAGDTVRTYVGSAYMQYTGSTSTLSFSGTSAVIASSVTGNEIYTSGAGWFRNTNSLRGLYNQTNANYIYSQSPSIWTIATASGATSGGLLFKVDLEGSLKGSVQWDATGFGLLDDTSAWALRVNKNVNGLGGNVYGTWTANNGLNVTGTLAATTAVTAPSATITTINSTNANLGTVISGVWNGTAVPVANGGTGGSSQITALTNLMPSGGIVGQVLKTGGAGSYYWAAESGASAPSGSRIDTQRLSYIATAGQTIFTAPTYVPGANQLRVYINGVRQMSTEYVETNTTTVTLNAPGAILDDIVLVEIDGYVIYVNTAVSTSFTPVGAITAVDVQNAIADLDSRKADAGQTMYLGTTAVALNRASAALALTGVTIDIYAPLASPTFSGTPSLPTGTIGVTQTLGDNSTKLATTAFVLGNTPSLTALTGSAKMPAGTTGERDGTPAFGYTRANSTLTQMEWYNGTNWSQIGGGATGAPGNNIFFENDQVVTANYTITAGKNAMSAGPITINNGVVVTVPTGSTWVVV